MEVEGLGPNPSENLQFPLKIHLEVLAPSVE